MTTETELRDLLDTEAGAAVRATAGWDGVVHRGRHRQRVRRVQRLGVVALVALAAVLATSLPSDDRKVDTTPPATEPSDTTVDGDPTTESSVELPDMFRISAVRAQGAFVTVAMLWERGTFDPCSELHPRVVESSDQVGIDLFGAPDGRARPWAACGVGHGGAWGTLELDDALDTRTVVDVTSGYELEVVEGAPLLLPTDLPLPFQLDRRYEAGTRRSVRDEQGYLTPVMSWSFAWRAGMSDLRLSIGEPASSDGCGGESRDVPVRGTTARLCTEPAMTGAGGDGGVAYSVVWEEGASPIVLTYVSIEDAPLSLDEVLAIAEGMEPLGG